MRAFLDKMSELYYKGTPAISDQEFDLLADKHDYTRV
jgi:NAD-dependent DNA ligase